MDPENTPTTRILVLTRGGRETNPEPSGLPAVLPSQEGNAAIMDPTADEANQGMAAEREEPATPPVWPRPTPSAGFQFKPPGSVGASAMAGTKSKK